MQVARSVFLTITTFGMLFTTGPLSAQDVASTNSSRLWESATPESQGFSSEKLNSLKELLIKRNTTAFLLIRNDKIVFEWYAKGQTGHSPQGTASLAKALVGGLSVAIALTDGKISLDDNASKYVPAWKADPLKSKITVRQLGSHTSGLSDASMKGVKHEELSGWMGDFWKQLEPPNDPFTLARDRAPVIEEPGTRLRYSNPAIGMLTYCVAAAMRDTSGGNVRTLIQDRILKPIGATEDEWRVGYGRTFEVDGLPLIGAWGGGTFSSYTTARLGRLVLREGDWDGQRVLSAESIRQVTQDAGMPGHCGMGWWNNGGRYPGLPKDAVWGAGAGDRVLLVIPSLQLIMFRSGLALHSPEEINRMMPQDVLEEFHDPRERVLFRPLIESIVKPN